ncbi:hypothetical protein F7R91_14050 [Streptomyces luteolifulvus]|uniref:Uncharacterized protein n=1 Tax=Streptomyces luteolifulvus TaxID=2615112 RepID=A0A6H9V4B4_9ACTN|nr:hypothetical protein F7R91_14050 [Streptomyces luteolifulvus]MXM64451.1 hypothetical protein [Streptomyces sp. HUCO-GS316]
MLLHDRSAGVGDGGHERQQHGQREGAHPWLLCARPGRWARRGERSASITNSLPLKSLPVVVPEQAMSPTADGVGPGRRHPQGG